MPPPPPPPPAPTANGRAKGLIFNYLREWVVDNHGEEAWKKALARALPGERELYDGILLASSWQPVAAWNGLCSAFFSQQYADPNVGMRAFCGFLGERELTTLVKMVLKLGSPEFMLKRTGFLWGRYFDTGTFTAEEMGPGHWRLSLQGPSDEQTTAGALTCANGPGPWLERGLALSGNPGTVRHVRCRYQGLDRCEFDARWTK
jgi:hypothetical protein